MTGLEPATSGVTGLRSNQLSYTPLKQGLGIRVWGGKSQALIGAAWMGCKLALAAKLRYPRKGGAAAPAHDKAVAPTPVADANISRG